jgi:hypothetical protein
MGGNPLSSVPSVGVGGSGPGSGLYHYVMPQVAFVFLLFLAILATWYFITHKHTKLISLVVVAVIVGVMVIDPKALGPLISWFAGLFQQL